MKKYLSLALALIMVLSLSATAFAAENPEAATTSVSYTGNGIESYTITVPSSMAPGDTGNVKVDGTWATNRKIVVTAPETVTLTNDIDGGQKTLALTFEGLDKYKAGKAIVYTVAETKVKGYKGVVTGNIAKGFTITNTHTPVKETTSPKTGSTADSFALFASLIALAFVALTGTGLAYKANK